jgi:SAM-dependent methyltransferase
MSGPGAASGNGRNRAGAGNRGAAPVFSGYARYYDLLYRDKDYAAEAGYVEGLIRKFHPSPRSILELGSGTGIHASLLAGRGYTVHGIERSPEMLARSLALSERMPELRGRLTFTRGDIRESRLHRRFDAVIALFHVISYQTSNEDVTAAFQTARCHLDPGGIFTFDVWYGPAVLTDRPAVRVKRMADDDTEVTRVAEPVLHPNENRVDVNYRVFVRDKAAGSVAELQEIHSMRYFFMPEIERIALHAGFRCLHGEEWLTGRAIGCDTWGVCFSLGAV